MVMAKEISKNGYIRWRDDDHLIPRPLRLYRSGTSEWWCYEFSGTTEKVRAFSIIMYPAEAKTPWIRSSGPVVTG